MKQEKNTKETILRNYIRSIGDSITVEICCYGDFTAIRFKKLNGFLINQMIENGFHLINVEQDGDKIKIDFRNPEILDII